MHVDISTKIMRLYYSEAKMVFRMSYSYSAIHSFKIQEVFLFYDYNCIDIKYSIILNMVIQKLCSVKLSNGIKLLYHHLPMSSNISEE